jgi:hypothetical protein
MLKQVITMVLRFYLKEITKGCNKEIKRRQIINTKLKKTWILKNFTLVIAAVVIIGVYGWVKGINNTVVTYEQDIKESWGMCKRLTKKKRLNCNLVNTVKVQPTLKREP